MKPPAAVFFDLDGTLIDTAADMGGALNRMLIARNRAPVPAEDYHSSVSHGSMALLKLGFPELGGNVSSLRAEFLSTYSDHIAAGSHLYSDVEAVLSKLEQHQIPWGIITNKPEGLTHKLLNALNLASRCCCIIGADTASHAKPHPAPMHLACHRTRVNNAPVAPDECFFLGDAERDIRAGRAVNMRTFIARWGYIDPVRDNLDLWGAHHHLNTPLDLLDFLPE